MGIQSINVENLFTRVPKMADYPHLSDEVRELIDYTVENNLKENKELRIRSYFRTRIIKPTQDDFWFMSWNDIIMLKGAIHAGRIYDVFKIVYKISEKQFNALNVFNCFAAYNYIVEKIKSIMKAEKNNLSGKYTQQEIDAGIEDLERFGISLAIDAVAKGDILQYEAVVAKPYAVIFKKLCQDHTINQIQKRLK